MSLGGFLLFYLCTVLAESTCDERAPEPIQARPQQLQPFESGDVVCGGNYELIERIHVMSAETGLTPFAFANEQPFSELVEPKEDASASVFAWHSFSFWPSFLPSVLPWPSFLSSLFAPLTVSMTQPPASKPKQGEYVLKNKFGQGGFGEVWLAVRTGTKELFVIKRLLVEKGPHVRQSGFREIHFGYLLRHQSRVARYEEFYEENGQLWLVFHYEGISLQNYLYHRDSDPSTQLTTLTPSKEWKALKADMKGGGTKMRDLAFQLLVSVAQIHEMNVINRDIKPANILLKFPVTSSGDSSSDSGGTASNTHTQASREAKEQLVVVHPQTPDNEQVILYSSKDSKSKEGGALPSLPSHEGATPLLGKATPEPSEPLHTSLGGNLRLADFGSGVDVMDPMRLYAGVKPSKQDSSLGYAPPEVLFGSEPYDEPKAYDLWSVGVVLLEVVLGSPEVFRLDGRTRAKLEAKLSPDVSPETRKQALLLGAFMELCLHENTEQFPTGTEISLLRTCNETHFDQEIKRWDSLGQGTSDIWLTRLIRGLLQWQPQLRLSAKAALSHAYFQGSYVCPICGKEHELEHQLDEHLRSHIEDS